MKALLCAALFAAGVSVSFAADVNVSVSMGQPGFYGQLDIGNVPQPQLIYTRPVVVQAVPEFAAAPPIYLHVPPGHEKHWNKHCAQYNACGRPVYFVRDDWYNREYVPHYQHGGKEHGHDQHDDHEHH